MSGWAGAIAAASTIGLLWRQAKEAVRSADISQKTLEHAQKTTEAQLRAYVLVDHAKFDPHNVAIMIVFKNTGSTPARDMKMSVQIIVAKSAEMEVEEETSVPTRHGPLGPGESFTFLTPLLGLKDGSVQRVQSGIATFIADGTLSYTDIFGADHSTRFRCFTSTLGGRLVEKMNTAVESYTFD